MTLSFAIPVSIILEGIMIVLESIVYAYSYKDGMYARIDQIYLGVAVPFLVFSFAWAVYFKPEDRFFTGWSRGLRATQGVLLIIIGGLMISSARSIESSWTCTYYETYTDRECQHYEIKLIAGVIALLNSFFYFLRPCKLPNVVNPAVVMNGVYGDRPPAYFVEQQPGTYVVQYQQGGGAVGAQIVTQQMQYGYYAPNANPPQFQQVPVPQGGIQQTST